MSAVAEMTSSTVRGKREGGNIGFRDRLLSDSSSADRSFEAFRWVICFVLAAAIHGGLAYYLAERFAETEEDSGVDGPVVMLDLPEALAPSIAPPQDLPPGPMQQDEVEESPPPKEEAKPPEPESEVTLPIPEPPKVEKPPAEKIEAAAPVAAKTPPPSVVRWQSQLAAHIEHFKRYPQTARAHGDAGTATVAFTIDREGHVLHSSIVQSSGSAALDQETLAMLVRAQPMPHPPDQLTDGELTFVMPVRFNIR
jgi:periplasmic protein TonB